MITRVLIGDRYQERGARGRVFTVVAIEPGFAVCEFTGGSRRRGEGVRKVRVFADTLRKRFWGVQ